SRTEQLPEVCARADVLVAAVGRANMVTADYVKPGSTVIDVGTNPTADGGLLGDVDAESVAATAGALTPVPGGVGPVTTQLLLRHTVNAAEAAAAKRIDPDTRGS
ncbi:MAG: bifunctional 5,10-methylene-tetrahydrofolate dehydrogenase/5,10-methylene-tetrahydrofolate cyclohydrolase, partial [Stackebrandtia sp.]